MKLKKKYSSATFNPSFIPCISVIWLTTHQFLLGFSENSPEENTNDNSFFHIMVTYDKVRRNYRMKIYFISYFIGSSF
jgi:hypothetical protein